MNKFEKVSYEQYFVAKNVAQCEQEWQDIKLPNRATQFDAGHDFYAPFDFELKPNETIKIPTGIRVFLDDDKFLACVPRSGLGFKYRLQLDNTIGIIDSRYVESDNEGHIWAKITNDGNENKTITINKGDAFMQGIILQYFKTDDDNVTKQRNGGLGSTSA